MQYDLGLTGAGILITTSLAFGVVAQIAGRAETPWLWLLGALGWFMGGLYLSEVLFAAATIDEIQPIVDGLAFDEALLGGLIGGTLATLVGRFLTGSSPFHRRSHPV